MPPSSSVCTRSDDDDDDHAPRPPGSSDSRGKVEAEIEREGEEEGDNEEEEEEYEEIEVEEEEEEEIEVEEEVEVEVEEEEEVEGEEEEVEEEEVKKVDKLDSAKEEGKRDVNQKMETNESDRRGRIHSTPKKSEPRIANYPINNIECSSKFSNPLNGSLDRQQGFYANLEDCSCCKSEKHLITDGGNDNLEFAIKRKDFGAIMMKENAKELNELHGSSKAKLCDDEDMVTKITSLPVIMAKDSPIPITRRDCVGEKAEDVLESVEELSMDVDLDDDNEQEEIRCGDMARAVSSSVRTRSLSPSSECRDSAKRPAVICDFFAKGWCIKGSSCRFLHVKDGTNMSDQELEEAASNLMKEDQPVEGRNLLLAHGESQRLHLLGDKYNFSSLQQDNLLSALPANPKPNGDPMTSSAFEDLGFESFGRNWPATGYGSCEPPISKGSSPLLRNSLLPGPGLSSNYHSAKPSNPCNLDDLGSIRSQYPLDPLFNTSLPSGGMLPSHPVSAWISPSVPYSSCLNTSSLGSQKLLDDEKDHHGSASSLSLQSASPFLVSESGKLPLTSIPGALLRYAEHKSQNLSNDWEPSVPFQPSFFITRTITSSPGSQYDPLRDSFDLPAGAEKSFKFSFSFSSQETPVLDTSHQQTCGDSLVAPESNASSYSHVKDSPNGNKLDNDGYARHKSDGSRLKKNLYVRQSNKIEVEQLNHEDTQKESKALRHFRAALVDFTKELLKPYWREGHVNKDVHNIIVKKAVEKVLSSFRSHRFPTNVESIKQYLSMSQPKILKLIEGYLAKYGKS